MIEVQSLTRYYGSRRAVDDVSFTIASNEVVGFLGLNGAGKSTTLKVLAGLLSPSRGTVRIDGVDLAEAPVSFRARIGYLPDDPPVYKEMTVEGYLRFVGSLRGMSNAQIDARLPSVLSKTQLEGFNHRIIDELSHGYKQRVGIAQAIIHQPKLVILDEPITGLDPVQIVEMRSVIRGLAQESTVLLSSHNLPEISQTCDHILVLHRGRLVAKGSEHDLAAGTRGGLGVDLLVLGGLEAFKAALGAQPLVASATCKARDGGLVEARVVLKEDRREALVAALVAQGFGIRRVEDTRGELETIFLDLTTREDAA